MPSPNLYNAARDGDLDAVRRLIAVDAEVNTPSGYLGETPLMAASRWGHTAIVRLLLEHGADPNVRTSKGYGAERLGERHTALMYAAMAGHIQNVELLLKHGADPQLTFRKKSTVPFTAADFAAQFGFVRVVSLLRNAGVMVNPKSAQILSNRSYKVRPEVADRLRAINWFVNCGKPLSISSLPLGTTVRSVASWDEAKNHCVTLDWQNTIIGAQNTITSYLFDDHTDAYNTRWNPTAIASSAFLQQEIYPKWVPILMQAGLDDSFTASVRNDLSSAILEDAYRDCSLPTNFFHELSQIYEAGHFPCGWIDGEWTAGQLLVL